MISGQGGKETRGQGDKGTSGQGNKGTRGQGDKWTREQGDKGTRFCSYFQVTDHKIAKKLLKVFYRNIMGSVKLGSAVVP